MWDFMVNVEFFGKYGILFKCACTICTYSILCVYFSNMFNLPVHTVRPYTQEYSTRDWKQLQFKDYVRGGRGLRGF